ncbi:MAG: ornithine carbamoyltransferase, partial [Victivallis vadensis]
RNKMNYTPLAGKSVGLIFAKSSTRTRVSFEVGVGELGGRPLYLDQSRMQVGRGETVADTAKVLSRYLHGIVIRTFSHADVEELAREASIPVINALTDEYHPCQILADMLTIKEYSGRVDKSIRVAFYGDGRSNIANSLMLAARLTGMEMVVSAPAEERPAEELMAGAPNICWEPDPLKAAEGVDYFYTDVWVSMGFEDEKERRMKIFRPYQVNEALFERARPNAKFLHCLPAHRGEEVSAGVMDDPKRSIVFDEAENRLHVQKAVMARLIK